MESIIKSLKNIVIFNKIKKSISKHPHIYTFLACLLYLLLLQFKFVTSGDIWAESFYEYVHGAIANGWQGFFYTGIAGYFNFLPKFFAYGYVAFGLPLQYIDYFFRIAVIAYALGCISFIGHVNNRYLIRNDYLRGTLALIVLMVFYHVSSFSFINIWYVGFIPIILVSLNAKKFSNQKFEVLYSIFAMSVCLSKPSLILLPLVIYRAIRLKEYLLGFVLLFAISLQTLLFLTSSYYNGLVPPVHIGILTKLLNTILYIGLLLLKLVQVHPWSFALVVASSLSVICLIVFAKKSIGLIQTGILSLTLLLATYTAIYSPDTPPVSLRHAYDSLFYDAMKLQREVLIYFFLLLFIFLNINYALDHFKHSKKIYKKVTVLVAVLIAVLLGTIYRPIETQSNNLYINIDAFRSDLRSNSATCMPIPPTPSWKPKGFEGPTYGWYFESGAYGSCTKSNYEKTINYGSFKHNIGAGQLLTIESAPSEQIKSILIPISNPQPERAATLILQNTITKQTFSSKIISKSNKDPISFVAFNLSHDKPTPSYRYILKESGVKDSSLQTGAFKEINSTALFPYFLVSSK